MGFLSSIIGDVVSDAVGSAVSSAVGGAISSAIEVNKEQKIANIRNQPKPEVILAECPNCVAANTHSLRVCPYCGSLLARTQDNLDVGNAVR